MPGQRFWTVAAFLFAAASFFLQIGGIPLLDPDEGRNAGVAREVMISGSWLVPTYNGVPYLDKPILFFKAVALSFRVFGVNEAGARIPSAVAALALVTVLYLFCRRSYGRRTATLAVFVTASTPLVLAFARIVIFDMPLTLFMTASILSVVHAERCTDRRRLVFGGLGAICAALATLVKGPVGLLVPSLVLLAWSLWQRRLDALRRQISILNVVLFLAVALPWFLGLVSVQPDFLAYGLLEETLRRYSTATFHRTAPFYYYAPVLLGVTFPWCVLLPQAAWSFWKRRARWGAEDQLFAAWAVVVLLFFSVSRSKLPGYILPGVVALAVLHARLCAQAIERPAGAAGRAVLRGAALVGVLGLLGSLFLLAHALTHGRLSQVLHFRGSDFLRLQPLFLSMGLALFPLSLLAIVASRLRKPAVAVAAFVLLPIVVVLGSSAALGRFARENSSRAIADSIPPLPEGSRIVSVESFAPGLPFYTGEKIYLMTRDGHEMTSNYVPYSIRNGSPWPEVLIPPERLREWLARQSGAVFLITRKKGRAVVDSLATAHGVAAREVARGWWGLLLPAGRN